MTRIDWISLSDRLPPDEQFVLLTGDSGYTSTPSFVMIGRRYEAFRPRHGGSIRWMTIGDSPISDYGWEPTHWAPLANRPSDLFCPQCGKVLEWACWTGTGDAYCTGGQTRPLGPGAEPGCSFRGPIRRRPDGGVEPVGWTSGKSPAPPPERWEDTDTMVFLPGDPRSFRCECGGNVFRESRDVPLHYKCNSCSATFTGSA
jgi:hypothetical protein